MEVVYVHIVGDILCSEACFDHRRLMTNLENCKHSVQRTRGITARFQVSSTDQSHETSDN